MRMGEPHLLTLSICSSLPWRIIGVLKLAKLALLVLSQQGHSVLTAGHSGGRALQLRILRGIQTYGLPNCRAAPRSLRRFMDCNPPRPTHCPSMENSYHFRYRDRFQFPDMMDPRLQFLAR